MMRKNSWIAAAALIFLGLVWGPVWAAEVEMCVPMGDITLEALSADAKRAAVNFPHAAHFGYSCQQCHHTWDRTTPVTGCSATGCHDMAEAPKTEDGRRSRTRCCKRVILKMPIMPCVSAAIRRYTKKTKKLQATRMPTDQKLAGSGPTGCIQCHPKE